MPLFADKTALSIIDSMAILIGQAYQLARWRIASASSPVLRMMTQRDHVHLEHQLLFRELQIMRDQRSGLQPHKRPEYTPPQRLAILQLMRLRGWNVQIVAKRFVLHPNTVHAWLMTSDGRKPSDPLVPNVPWNKIDDAVRWAVHELRRLFPEPEIGTRTIARHLIRSSIQISRRTVQRVLQEPARARPRRPRPPMNPPMGVEAHNLLAPADANRVWQLDLMSRRIFWFSYTVAALIDGYSRRLLRLQVFPGAPTSRDLIHLVRHAAAEFDAPRFILTDHGCQFRHQFKKAMRGLGIDRVRGCLQAPSFNGKVERLFKTIRQWHRFIVMPLTLGGIQRRLDQFQSWYNAERPHQAANGMTPDEAWHGMPPPEPLPYRAVDDDAPHIQIRRRHHGNDPRLPVVHISVTRQAA